ncbi:Non-specific serine/threonine protein kinase protein [Dioscorea alata]|uniref:Non-specific serine/threonine protein kinase protein n=1 Tax=Dioscorea alata TaxID=55571 RepID=A0ACB7WQ75_DIOAL|nr:Non-specific serine/threonine protein kinase protein [Dioscorea alata]
MAAKLTEALLLCLLCFILCVSNSLPIYGCKEGERKALLNFKEGLKDPGGRLSSWIDQDCCSWRGVQCDDQTGHVVQLDLGNKIPLHNMFQYGQRFEPLEGEINPALVGLKHLQYLDLSMNFFGGIQIPAFLGSFQKLRYLDLSCAGFSGVVPHQLGNLSSLQYLDLSNVFYLPCNHLQLARSHWLSNLSSLQYLNLNFVDLSKASDWLESLNTLPLISEINLSNCTLEVPLSLAHVNFTKLKVLDLSSNYIHSGVPPWLFKLRSLENLDLSANAFKELIPSAIGNLTSLRVLNLANNRVLEGGVPLSLKNLCMLKSLDLSENKYLHGDLNELEEVFSGCIKDSLETLNWIYSELKGHFPNWLGRLKSLKMLNLYYNSFYGPFLQFGLHSLIKLDISRNTLNGSVPVNLGQLYPKLEFLDFAYNNLTGVLTEAHLAGLAKLQHLGISANELSVGLRSSWVPPLGLKALLMFGSKLGPGFPSWIQKLENLSVAEFSNAGISDTLPDWFWNFSKNLQLVRLSNNDIKGKLPASLEHLSGLWYVDLSGNSFEGSVSQFPANLVYLFLSSNKIAGRIPETLCYLKKLAALDLSKNQLISEIPDCWNHSVQPKLFTFDLSDNQLSGGIPTTICSPSLAYLHLSNNNLSGELPLSLRNCRALMTLDLGQNKIGGSIPTWLANSLLNLEVLGLRNNMLAGDIPPELGNLTGLRVIDFAYNYLSGTIPYSLGNLRAMKFAPKIFYNTKVALEIYDKIAFGYIDSMEILYMVSNKLLIGYMDNVNVNLKGRDVQYDKLLPLLISIDLSRNELSGEIPEELMYLSYLQNLDLSGNHLTGRIPEKMGMLLKLESLDLSNNDLSGAIPTTMIMLSFLSHLNLSYNNLSGRIPQGGQFLALPDPSIYFGNYALCGFPLDNNCEDIDEQTSVRYPKDEDEVEKIGFYVSIALGYNLGFWVLWGVLLLNKKWGYAYFQFVDYLLFATGDWLWKGKTDTL